MRKIIGEYISPKWKQTKDNRLEALKALIRPLDFVPFKNEKNLRLVQKGQFPLKWRNDILKIVKQYDCIFTVFYKGHHGFNRRHKLVYLAIEDEHDYLSSYTLIEVFPHELAHAIQYDYYPKSQKLKRFKDRLEYEQEACRLAYFISKKYFSHVWKDIDLSCHHKRFNTYSSKKNIAWFKNYHKEHYKLKYKGNLN